MTGLRQLGLRPSSRPSSGRQDALLAVAATVLGLWLGFAAPSVSPVGPPPTDPAVVSQAAGPVVQAAPAPDAPTDPVAPAGADGRGGHQGRAEQGQ